MSDQSVQDAAFTKEGAGEREIAERGFAAEMQGPVWLHNWNVNTWERLVRRADERMLSNVSSGRLTPNLLYRRILRWTSR